MSDRYLKGVLTVIAGALVWIAIQLSMGTAQAAKRGDAAMLLTRDEVAKAAELGPQEQLVVPVYCVNCK